MGSAGRDYALGAFFIVLAVLAFMLLDGSTAVFTCIAAAIVGAVMIVRGAQTEHFTEDPLAADEYGITGPRGEYVTEQNGTVSLDNADGGLDSGFDSGLDSGFDWDAHYKREFGEGKGLEN